MTLPLPPYQYNIAYFAFGFATGIVVLTCFNQYTK